MWVGSLDRMSTHFLSFIIPLLSLMVETSNLWSCVKHRTQKKSMQKQSTHLNWGLVNYILCVMTTIRNEVLWEEAYFSRRFFFFCDDSSDRSGVGLSLYASAHSKSAMFHRLPKLPVCPALLRKHLLPTQIKMPLRPHDVEPFYYIVTQAMGRAHG